MEIPGDIPNVTDRRTCPLNIYDCRTEQIHENSLHEHYLSEEHQRTVTKCAAQINADGNNDSATARIDTDEELSPVSEAYKKLLPVAKNIESAQLRHGELSDKSVRCSHYASSLPERVKEMQNTQTLATSSINATLLNENILRQEAASLKEQVENQHGTLTSEFDGILVWKLPGVREKTYDAMSERQTSVYSRPFYTSACGYKLCIRLYFNGDGTAQGTYLSIFLVILRGEYDALLTWPFPGRVCFCLCDQRTMIESNGTRPPKHVIECFRPDINSISFQRPTSEVNIASGIPRFLLLSEFNRPSNENLYIVDDTIFIKALIDFSNTSRSMLPFICNVNLALPARLRQKLIAEETKRRQEQQNN